MFLLGALCGALVAAGVILVVHRVRQAQTGVEVYDEVEDLRYGRFAVVRQQLTSPQ